MNSNNIFICSIDPGKVNLAFCIEEVNVNDIKTVDDIIKNGKTHVLENVNVSANLDKNKYLDTRVFLNITDLLDKYKSYWEKMDIILIEQQMSFGRNKNNTMALKIAQHCFSYFSINYRDRIQIYEYPSYHKTQVLNAPKGINKPARKKWAIEKAIELFSNRKDGKTISMIESKKKRDDVSDCLLMIVSFICQVYIFNKNF